MTRSFRLLYRNSKSKRALVVVPAALVMAVTALGTAAHSAPMAVPWRVTGNVVFQMMDSETFGKNPTCHHDNPVVNQGFGQLPQNIWYYGKCGGEVRAEIHYKIFGNSDGSVSLGQGNVYLYEGTSDDTRDLDGGFPFGGLYSASIHIPKGQSVTKTFHVSNTAEDSPDDHADITITWRNG
ncbi:hypothetical protein ABT255_03555 [Streptomyces mirabilis]|uniref:hypothetical protein n=1 Tax=Streptomyces mirabilis TaxID=68239 RepID=UPI003321A46A